MWFRPTTTDSSFYQSSDHPLCGQSNDCNNDRSKPEWVRFVIIVRKNDRVSPPPVDLIRTFHTSRICPRRVHLCVPIPFAATRPIRHASYKGLRKQHKRGANRLNKPSSRPVLARTVRLVLVPPPLPLPAAPVLACAVSSPLPAIPYR
jgi:hypothetical protein